MEPKRENVDTNDLADEIAEYIYRKNFWVDTRETSDENATGHYCTFGDRSRQLLPRSVLKD